MATEQTDAQITQALNARCLRTGQKTHFTRLIVRHIRRAYDITSYFHHLRNHGWLTVPPMTALMKVHPAPLKQFAREGVLAQAVRANDSGLLLFEPATVRCLNPCLVNHSEIDAISLSLHSRCRRGAV